MPLERPRPKSSEPASAPSQAPAKPLVSLPPVLQNTAPAESARAVEPEPVLASSSAENSSGQPAPAQVRPVPQRVGGAPGADAAGKSGTEADAGTLDQYRLALIVATRRYKRYPAIAMEKGWQGRVEVRMVIGADGMMLHASIKAGSGYDVLDNQALDMLKKGKTTVPIPLGLRGREFSIDVPVIFNLDSPNS
jgi:protein TonB